MRFARPCRAKNHCQRMRTIVAKKVAKKVRRAHLCPSGFRNLLERRADRRSYLKVPIAVDRMKEAVRNMFRERVDDLPDSVRVPAKIVPHYWILPRRIRLTRAVPTPKLSIRGSASGTASITISPRS